MQILIKYDKTYTIDIESTDSMDVLSEKIETKTLIPKKMQLLIFQGKIINHLKLVSDAEIETSDCIHLSVRRLGGNFVSMGSLVVGLLISLAIYSVSYPIIFYGLELITANANTTAPASSTSQLKNYFDGIFRNNNALGGIRTHVLNKILPNNQSLLLYIYLGLSLLVWFLYSSTITMIINAYFQCQQEPPTSGVISNSIALFLIYLSVYLLLWWMNTKDFVQNYSIAIYSFVSLIFLISYYFNTLKNYDFNLIYYFILTAFVLFFYYHLITTGDSQLSYFKLFGILPMLGGIFYIVSYLNDYYNIFSKPC